MEIKNIKEEDKILQQTANQQIYPIDPRVVEKLDEIINWINSQIRGQN